MRIRYRIRFLGLFCLLLFLCAPHAAAAASVSSASVSSEEETYRRYMGMFRADPDNVDVNMGLARAALAAGRPHQAIMAYERLLVKYPDDQGLWRELASVYASIGDADMAESCAVNAAGGGGRWRRSARLRLGVFFDDNANQATGGEWFDLGGTRYRVEGQEEISSPGLTLGGQMDASYNMSGGSPWYLTGGLGFSARIASNTELNKIDRSFLQWYRAFLGLRRADASNLFEARAVFELSDYNFYDSIYSYGAEAFFVRAVNPRFHLITSAGLSYRRHVRNMDQTGVYWYAGQSARFLFGGGRHEFTAGARLFAADTKSDMYVNNMKYDKYSYDGWEAFAAFNFRLGGGFELAPGITYRERSYRAPATSLEFADGISGRKDSGADLNLGLTYHLNEAAKLELTYRYTVNSSNSELYEYDRSLLGLGVVWTF